MEKKTFYRGIFLSVPMAFAFFAVFFAAFFAPGSLGAGEVKTKDRPKECGGYHGGSYHLKCRGENKNYVDRDQNMKNPFKGFTKGGSGKPKKQGEMPHSK